EAVVHTHEGGERWVNARDLHLNKAQQSEASAGTPVAFHANATDAEFLYGRQQIKGEGISHPVVRDDRRNLRFHELAYALDERQLLRGQRLVEIVKITIRRWQWLWRLGALRRCW